MKTLLHDDPDQVTVGELASIRQLMFDAQTLSAAQVKHVLAGSDAAKKAELVPAERAQRIQAQREKLAWNLLVRMSAATPHTITLQK